ncbi:DNA kinase/phosphatase Pnk1 [Tieghemiomyces parasiticus]|uniref:DNA kinase/phosphatase Pnk1 n=1 Tax=Tieghemiomyces parasiticus TaxID=78921 RepID=A0A9W8AK51_9FUNG|nr:DNA kinase/phosphatase Pnk1 [Tieghemiomyces parasiticus]
MPPKRKANGRTTRGVDGAATASTSPDRKSSRVADRSDAKPSPGCTPALEAYTLHSLAKPIAFRTSQASLATFFKAGTGKSKDSVKDTNPVATAEGDNPADGIEWLRAGSLILGLHGSPKSSGKVAFFDLDQTLITVKGNHRFSKNADDWQWLFKDVPERLRKLHSEGYKIVIITNQMGLRKAFDKGNTKGFTQFTIFRDKLNQVAASLQLPFQLLGAIAPDLYRKPNGGMFHFFTYYLNDGVPARLADSFYVGDAAGRANHWKPGVKADHSDCDRKFAANLGLPFQTPEEHFRGEAPADYQYPGEFDPSTFPAPPLSLTSDGPGSDTTSGTYPRCCTAETLKLRSGDSPEVIVAVGFPASGKSTLACRVIEPAGYVYVNQDTLRTRAKCVEAVRAALAAGRSVIVDNTNPEAATRAHYIDLARAAGCPVRCLHFTAPLAVARHNSRFRAYGRLEPREFIVRNALAAELDHLEELPTTIPMVVFHTFNSRLEPPTADEGFSEVLPLNFHLHPEYWGAEAPTMLAKWRCWHE